MTASKMLEMICELPPRLRDTVLVRAYVQTLPRMQSAEISPEEEARGLRVIRTARLEL